MVASILESGKVEVECVCTHYSHQIELQHVWIPKGCRREGTTNSRRNQTRDDIKDICQSVDESTYGGEQVVSNQGIPDIVDIYVTGAIQRHTNDQLNLLSWIKQWESSPNPSPVFMYKIEGNSYGVDITELTGFKHDDFIIVIQSQLQREMMKKFSPNGVCFDYTIIPVSKMVLASLQVIDDTGQTLPVTWCLSNTNADFFMKIFFTKLKQVCGDLTPAWVMSPCQEPLYESWMSVFGPACRHLICPWSLESAWSEMLKKTLGKTEGYKDIEHM